MKAFKLYSIAGTLALVTVAGGQPALAQDGTSTVKSYVGGLSFQGQSINKDTASFLHTRLLQQRATQLVTWAMPMMNFETLYPALLENLGREDDGSIFMGLYDGYDGVYPFMTANVTTSYTLGMSDLSKTGPVVIDLPPGAIYGVVDDAWMQPIHEIVGKEGKVLLVGPGQKAPDSFDGQVVQSDTFRVLYFYRALGTGDDAKALRTAVKVYKLSETDNPPKTEFVKYKPKAGGKIALNTQPRDMRFWELVNTYVQREPVADCGFQNYRTAISLNPGQPFQ